MPRTVLTALLAVLALLGACSKDEPERDEDVIVLSPPSAGEGHAHGPGVATVVGDGTRSSAGGFSLVDVRLPDRTGQPGELSFRIVDRSGRPVRDFVEEQTKLLHLYVVSEDLRDFRHLHPTLGDDGTWTARVALAGAGPYRVLTEFTPRTDPGVGHVVLGRSEAVPGSRTPAEVVRGPGAHGGPVHVAVDEPLASGPHRRMRINVDDGAGGAVTLGGYLGSYAHVTGFDVDSGSFVHVHPYREPEVTADGTRLSFHTEFREAGRYRFFVQVRVDGFLHTVPVTAVVE